jgi:hypothetical protein
LIDFPASPSIGQTHTVGSIVWTFDGTKWCAPQTVGAAPTVIAPTTGQTVALSTGTTIVNPAGPLAALTLTLPASGSVRLSTRQRIDALTVTGTGTVDWATGELPANGQLSLTFVSALSAWVRAAIVLALLSAPAAAQIVQQAPTTFSSTSFQRTSGVIELTGMPAAIGWVAGVDPAQVVIFTASRSMTVTDIRGRVTAGVGSAATAAVYKAPSGTSCASGTLQHTGTFDANGTANTNQSLTLAGGAANTLAVGDSLCLVTTGTWTGGAGNGAITVTVR